LLLKDIAKILNSKVNGNSNIEITRLCSVANPDVHSICVIKNRKFLTRKIIESTAALVITREMSVNMGSVNNFLVVKNIDFALLQLCELFRNDTNELDNFTNNSFISSSSSIGKNFQTGQNVVIESNCLIGKNVTLGHNVVIHRNTIIGDNVVIGSGTIIGSEGFGNVIKDDKSWSHIVHLGSVSIGHNVRIGSNCNIDRATIDKTTIDNGVIIDNQVHIAHNVFIGENTAIAANVGIAGSCKIGKRNMIGGMVGIIDHITTTDDVTISATSSVTQNLKEPGVYTGIMPISKHSLWKRIALWITKLDKIAKLLDTKKI